MNKAKATTKAVMVMLVDRDEKMPGLLLGVLDGGALERRILRLIDARLPWSRRYRVVSAVCCLVMLSVASVGVTMLSIRPSAAQVAEVEAPKLEVASVKKVEGRPSMVDQQLTPDGLSEHGWTLGVLIHNAYIRQFPGRDLIVGLPSWVNQERYDIVGKVSEADVAKLRNPTQEQAGNIVQAMLRQVLKERFQLKTHEEDRENSFFALVVGKNGLKLKKATPGDTYPNGVKGKDGSARGPGLFGGMGNQMIGQGVTLDALAFLLTGTGGRVVVNRTGLTGRYDFTLSWTPEQMGSPTPDAGASTDANGPSIYTALQEQLGLRLEPAKGPVKTLVVESIERPSEN